jgi:hypothetical protein
LVYLKSKAATFASAMKQFLSLFLACCIFGQTSIRTAWALHYQWNRAVYLKNCENRDKADLHCDGKCYLKKKIAASENPGSKEPQLPAGFHQIKDIQLYFEPFEFFPTFRVADILEEKFPINVGRLLPDAHLVGVFKPPAA